MNWDRKRKKENQDLLVITVYPEDQVIREKRVFQELQVFVVEMVSLDLLDLLDEKVIEVLMDWKDFLDAPAKKEKPVEMDRWVSQDYEDLLDHREVVKEDQDHQDQKDHVVSQDLPDREEQTVFPETQDQEVP